MTTQVMGIIGILHNIVMYFIYRANYKNALEINVSVDLFVICWEFFASTLSNVSKRLRLKALNRHWKKA